MEKHSKAVKLKQYDLEIGSGSFIPGFEEQLVGLKQGEEKDVEVNFPEEYHAAELAGKPAVFKVKVHEIKAKEVPDLTMNLQKKSMKKSKVLKHFARN